MMVKKINLKDLIIFVICICILTKSANTTEVIDDAAQIYERTSMEVAQDLLHGVIGLFTVRNAMIGMLPMLVIMVTLLLRYAQVTKYTEDRQLQKVRTCTSVSIALMIMGFFANVIMHHSVISYFSMTLSIYTILGVFALLGLGILVLREYSNSMFFADSVLCNVGSTTNYSCSVIVLMTALLFSMLGNEEMQQALLYSNLFLFSCIFYYIGNSFDKTVYEQETENDSLETHNSLEDHDSLENHNSLEDHDLRPLI